jgi:hypothetical protein
MIEFKRVQISGELVLHLGDLLWKGKSVVLLGPRHIGKRFVARRVCQHLVDLGHRRLATVAFITDRSQEFDEAGVGDTAMAGDHLQADFAEVLRWVDERLAEGPGPVTLIATNLDARPPVEILEFLSDLRSRIEGQGSGTGSLSVALTGEMDLSRFTYGSQSALTCHHQFLIQGFARDEFREYARHFLGVLGPSAVSLHEPDIERLYERAGGNVYFFRLLLWSACDRLAQQGGPPSELFGPKLGAGDYPLSRYYFRYISHLIDANPSCWPDLERLVVGRGKEVDCPDPNPHPLELAGAAVRARGRLKLSNPLIRDFVLQHYKPRRFGDLHARVGDWPGAFERYERDEQDHREHRTDPAQRLRPTDLEDLGDAELVVEHLRTSLYRAATEAAGPDGVLWLFCEGCRWVLGFSEVTRWRHIREWAPVEGKPFDRPAEGADHLGVLGRIRPDGPAGRVCLDDDLKYSVVAVRVTTEHPDVHEVVLVGHPGSRNILSAARERMTQALADDFVSAYDHALQHHLHLRRRAFQKDFARFVSDVAVRLGSEIFDVQGVMKAAAARLRELGYSRVVFTVLDPARRYAIPVAMEYDPEVYSGVRPPWPPVPLQGGRLSASRWVVDQRKPLVTSDAAADPRVREKVANKLKIKGAAVVPMLNPAGEVVGTIQIEHANGLRPTDEEVNDLLDFGGKLAVALALIEQVAMLQAALGTLREPIAIFGRDGKVRYINFWAADPVGLKPRWYGAGQGPRYNELQPHEIAAGDLVQFVEVVGYTLRSAKSMFQPGQAIYKGRTIHFATMAEPLWDWRRQLKDRLELKDWLEAPGDDPDPADSARMEQELLAGVLLHARDDTALRLTFQALEVLVERAGRSSEVVSRTIEAIRVLGHRWARLYKTDEHDTWRLVSADGFGFANEAVAAKFRANGFPLADPRDGRLWGPWYCFQAREPVVLIHDPDRPDGDVVRTRRGLKAKNCLDTGAAEEFRKKPGELWIDFPLEVDGTRVGKLTIECPEDLRPDHLELLGIFCKLTSALLRASLENEKVLQERAGDYQRTAERTLHDVIHNIHRYFNELSPAISRLGLSADDLLRVVRCDPRIGAPAASAAKELAEARDRVNAVYGQIYAEIESRMHQKLEEPVKTLRTDLYSLFRKLAASRFEGASVLTDPPGAAVEVVADVDAGWLLRSLERLVQAGARYPRTGKPVQVSVSAAIVPREGAEWVAITVSDDGRGLPKDAREQLFEAADGAATGGLGLADVRAMAEAHGGSVSYTAARGRKSAFTIEFPRYRAAVPAEGRRAGAEAPQEARVTR